jgi:hypothetical protein
VTAFGPDTSSAKLPDPPSGSGGAACPGPPGCGAALIRANAAKVGESSGNMADLVSGSGRNIPRSALPDVYRDQRKHLVDGTPAKGRPMQVTPPLSPVIDKAQSGPGHDAALRAVAVKLESTFLSEMFRSAGLGETAETFGGGIGEDQFASFLSDAQAGKIAAGGGIGLAESIFRSLKARD